MSDELWQIAREYDEQWPADTRNDAARMARLALTTRLALIGEQISEPIALAAARAELADQGRVIAAVEAAVDQLARFDCIEQPVPGDVDVPDDFEAGIHGAARALRAALADADSALAEVKAQAWDEVARHFAGVCDHDGEPHGACSALIAAHDAAYIVRRDNPYRNGGQQ